MPGAWQHSILIIDDDPISREVMAMTLEMHGYAISSAADGDAAVSDLLQATCKPDLVLADTQMPGISGLALIEALRSAGVERIVAISASDPGKEIRNASDGFLLKPVTPEAVAALFQAPVQLSSIAAQAETVTSSTQAPAVDPEILRKFKAMMPASAVREIYVSTAEDMKIRLGHLQAAIDAANAAEVSRIAHSIKGSCAMVGLSAGREAAARLEVSNLPVTWPAEVAQLHFALEGLEVMLADDFSA